MSTAYKHLYSCVTFLIFVFVLNFYKNRIHVHREREASSLRSATKLKRTGALNRPPHPVNSLGDEFLFDLPCLDLNRESETTDPGWLHWDRSKQYPGRCLDVEVFLLSGPKRMTTTRRKALDGGPEGLHYKSTVLLGERGKRKDHEQPDNAVQNSSIYVFLSVLVVLLLAAGVDIAKHLTGSDRNGGREDAKRRLSLQNYQALIREKQKQFRMMKQHYSQPSISIQRSMDESVPGAPSAGAFARMEEAPSPVGKSIPTPRLQRRQSVPTLMRTQLVPLGGGVGGAAFSTVQHVPPPFGRRTSIDSFWDVDHTIKGGGNGPTSSNGSPPEVRRRVRMLHRH